MSASGDGGGGAGSGEAAVDPAAREYAASDAVHESLHGGVETLQVLRTPLTADCVESCPIEGNRDVVAVCTYELNKADGTRRGQVALHKLDGVGSDKTCLVEHSVTDMPGILDAKWSHHTVAGQTLLGTAATEGLLRLYSLSDDCKLDEVVEHKLDDDASMCLSLDWNNRVSHLEADVRVAVSQTDSTVSVFRVGEGELKLLHRWRAHQFVPGADIEVWIVSFDYYNPNVLYSGADDSMLKGWDTRTDCRRPTFVSEAHRSGVCSMHCHPYDVNVLATGSYDETICIWDTRNFSEPVMQAKTGSGGGVWRLKWHPSISRPNTLLAACMRNGFQLWDMSYGSIDDMSGDVSYKRSTVYKHHSDESIAYGVDWAYSEAAQASDTPEIVSCSFYDKLVHLWRPNIGPAKEY